MCPMSRTAAALRAGDALADLFSMESQGLVGDPAQARRRSRASMAKRSGTRASSVSSRKRLALSGRLRGLSRVSGQPSRSRRRRGISAAQLRGFRRVVRLLHSIGMQPKKLRVKKKA